MLVSHIYLIVCLSSIYLINWIHDWGLFWSLCFWMCFTQVHIVVDNLDVNSTNSVNLRAAVSAALLLLPSEFSEVYFFLIKLFTLRVGQLIWFNYPLQADLYAKVCSLSYMGDVRMLFAEDKNKVFLGCH